MDVVALLSPAMVGLGLVAAEWRARKRDSKNDGVIETKIEAHGEHLTQHDQEFSTVKNGIADLRERVGKVEVRCGLSHSSGD